MCPVFRINILYKFEIGGGCRRPKKFQTGKVNKHWGIHTVLINSHCPLLSLSTLVNEQGGFYGLSGCVCLHWPLKSPYFNHGETHINILSLKGAWETSLVVQWLRIHLPRQETLVWSLVWEDPTSQEATKPVCRKYRGQGLEPVRHKSSPGITARERPCHCSWRTPRAATKTQHDQKWVHNKITFKK